MRFCIKKVSGKPAEMQELDKALAAHINILWVILKPQTKIETTGFIGEFI